jgi:hypothetical protein
MENVPCKVVINDIEIEKNLMGKIKSKPTNPRECCPKR